MTAEPAVLSQARQGGFGPGVYLPMLAQDGPMGALVVARDAGAAPFTDAEVAVVEVFASAAAVGIALGAARDAVEDLHIVSEHERIRPGPARHRHPALVRLGDALTGALSAWPSPESASESRKLSTRSMR